MGILRWWLAICVVMAHFILEPVPPEWIPINGVVAVLMFFALSGFYMQMLVSEVYRSRPGWVLKFYQSRYFRIFVPYYIALPFMLVMSTVIMVHPYAYDQATQDALSNWILVRHKTLSFDNPLSSLYILLTNLFILGSDQKFTILFDRKTFDMIIATPANVTNSAYISGTLTSSVPQIWSVATELYFYLLTPLVIAGGRWRNGLMAALLAVSLGYYLGYHKITPYFTANMKLWVCFKNVYDSLWIFLAGAMSYRFYAVMRDTKWFKNTSKHLGSGMLLIIIAATVVYRHVDHQAHVLLNIPLDACYIGLTVIGLPFIYARFKNNRLDRKIGELSYPIYLLHYGIGQVVVETAVAYPGPWALVLSCIVAALFVRYVEEPLTRWRHRRFRPHSAPDCGSAPAVSDAYLPVPA